jgi:leucyl/phenylalanyl-tRNA--protein transferase
VNDYVGHGLDLEPATLLAAYRQGLFPMPDPERGRLDWFSPDPRGVLPLAGLRVSRSLLRACRRFRVTVDEAFDEVTAGCADPQRPMGWINDDFRRAYGRLHELGHAHSVEVWSDDGALVGGLYGVSAGGLFAGESMVHRRSDASKVALVALVRVLAADGRPQRLLDVQWATPHLASLGVVEIRRRTYLRRLAAALEVPEPRWLAPTWPPAGQDVRRTA